MNFIYSGFLFALLSVSIPIIVHLFNFRRFKKIYFTNVRFLREVKEETRSRSKVKHLLILLSRILAIIFLVLAFAQPYIPVGKNIQTGFGKTKIVSVYVDNSFSMDAMGKTGTLIDEARRKAKEIVLAYKADDRFQLLTNDFEGRHQRILSREEFATATDEIKSSPAVKKISEVVSRQAEVLNGAAAGNGEKISYILSDFQKTIADVEHIKSDSGINIHFIPLIPQERNNIYIDSIWFSSPVIQLNQPVDLHIRIVNNSENAVENIPLKLFINGVQKGLASIGMNPREATETKLSFSISDAGWQKGQISITDFPVIFDDNFFFSFNIAQHLQVLSINGQNESPYLNALIGKDDYFAFKNTPLSRIDYSSFAQYQLIILNQPDNISSGLVDELQRFVKKGGSLIIFPSSKADLASYNSLMQMLGANAYGALVTNNDKVAKIEMEHEIFRDVFEMARFKNENIDLPVVKKYFTVASGSHSSQEVLLKLQSGQPFLSKYALDKGKIYAFDVPLDAEFSNFGKHAIFVPVIYKIALLSARNYPLSYIIGKNDFIEYDEALSGDQVFHLTRDKSNFDIIPEHRADNTGSKTTLFIHDQVKEAGNYGLTDGRNALAIYSFNYDRRESNLSSYKPSELEDAISKTHLEKVHVMELQGKEFKRALVQLSQGIRLWKLCLILTLLFLALEILLIRFWKPQIR